MKDIAKELNRILKNAEGLSGKDYSGYREAVVEAGMHYLYAMFPNFQHNAVKEETETRTQKNLEKAEEQLSYALRFNVSEKEANEISEKITKKLPEIMWILLTDIRAGYEGDPAAKSFDEIILAYPAFTAIGIHRIAHELYVAGQVMPARIMSEYAHSVTGIDIHPGATIGESFFIDHGTGVVIGETAVIGCGVKLYQGVTLGARSVPSSKDGSSNAVMKRHPNIGNHVVIYAGATLLGNISIGDDCVIGGNVWLTHSVPAGEKVMN